MLGWVVKWKTSFREYSGVVVEWVVGDAEAKACADGFKCMVYENITDELYHFNGDDKHQLSFVRPSIKDYVEYKRRVFLRANNGNVVVEAEPFDNPSKTEPVASSVEGIRTIHDAIIEELHKLDDIRILKQRQDAIKNELTLKSITMKNLKVQELNKSIVIPHLSSRSSRESLSISGKTVSEAVDSVSHVRREDDENTTVFISESESDEDDDSDADSSDDDDDDDDGEEDDDDNGDGKIDVKVKISTTSEMRGFSIRLNERGLGKVFAAVKRDYDYKPALYFVDRDGDRISIKTIDDLRYAHRSCSTTNTILKLIADSLEKEKPTSSRALKIERVASKRIVFVDSPLPSPQDDDRQAEVKSDAVSSLNSPTTNAASKQFEVLWKKGELVGRGSFGKVYSGINLTTGERIAVKEVRVRRSKRNKQQLKALQQEIRILGSLEHRNIIKYLGTEFTNCTLRIFLELATDGTIKDAIKEFGPFPEPLMRRFTTDILDGLEYLHSKNFIHRDIKPTNLLVSGGIVKLGDFGCSSIMIDGNDSSEEVANKTMAGTAIYMAPEVIYAGNNDDLCEAAISHSLTQTPLEQAPQLKEATLRITKSIGSAKASQITGYGRLADIWSLGATLFEMATGRPPYPNAGAAIYAIAVSKKFPVFPDLFSMEAHNFLGRCMVEDPSYRACCEELRMHSFLSSQTLDEMRAQTTITMPADAKNCTSMITLELPNDFSFSADDHKLSIDDMNSPKSRSRCSSARLSRGDNFNTSFMDRSRLLLPGEGQNYFTTSDDMFATAYSIKDLGQPPDAADIKHTGRRITFSRNNSGSVNSYLTAKEVEDGDDCFSARSTMCRKNS